MKAKKPQSADPIQQHVACLRESDLTHIAVTLLCNSLKNISFVDTAIRLIKASGRPLLFKNIFDTLPSIVTQPSSATGLPFPPQTGNDARSKERASRTRTYSTKL